MHAQATTLLTPYVFSAERPRRLSPEERARLTVEPEPPPFTDDRRPRVPWGDGGSRSRVHVRFSDVDILGHVNNVRYLDYLQDAQTDLAVGVFQEARVNGTVHLVVARTEVDYVGQMNLRAEPYDVRTRVEAVGTSSVTYGQEIRDGDLVMARSRLVSVNVDDEGRPREIHPAHRELFELRREQAQVS